MSRRTYLIIIAHTHACTLCRGRLLNDPEATLAGHALSDDEKTILSELKSESYLTPDTLTRATSISNAELEAYRDEGVVRLRHI
jgi:hypothetical protein